MHISNAPPKSSSWQKFTCKTCVRFAFIKWVLHQLKSCEWMRDCLCVLCMQCVPTLPRSTHNWRKCSSVKSLASWLPYSIIMLHHKAIAFVEVKQPFQLRPRLQCDDDFSKKIHLLEMNARTSTVAHIRKRWQILESPQKAMYTSKNNAIPYLGFCILPCNYLFSFTRFFVFVFFSTLHRNAVCFSSFGACASCVCVCVCRGKCTMCKAIFQWNEVHTHTQTIHRQNIKVYDWDAIFTDC